MARKKKAPEVEIFNEKKMDAVYDFGQVTVPTSWEEVTLGMYTKYLTMADKKEKQYEEDCEQKRKNKETLPDKEDEKYNMTDKDLLLAFSDFDVEKLDILPLELYNAVMGKMSFLMSPMEQKKPTNRINYKGNDLIINDKESMKIKEYNDVETVIRSNPYDYPSILAILCRKITGRKTDNVTGLTYPINEDYDSEFANRIFDGRRKMFEDMPVTEALPLISFFLWKSMMLRQFSQKSLAELEEQVSQCVQSIKDLQESGDSRKSSLIRSMTNLLRFKK